MASRQYIGCTKCKDFLDTDKFCPDDRYGKFQYGFYETDRQHILTSISKVKKDFLIERPEHYFNGIIQLLQQFIDQHSAHSLIIYKAGGDDLPWYEGQPNWYDWKQIGIEESPIWLKDTELPRNIIETKGILNWEEALIHYRENCVFVDRPEKVKEPFLKHLEIYKIRNNLQEKDQSFDGIKSVSKTTSKKYRKVQIVIADIYTCHHTFCNYINNKYKSRNIDFREIIRTEIETKSKLGSEIQKTLDKGKMVKVEILNQLIRKEISKDDSNLTILNYPRTQEQYIGLVEILRLEKIKINKAWHLNLINIDFVAEKEYLKINTDYSEKHEITIESIKDRIIENKTRINEIILLLKKEFNITTIEVDHEIITNYLRFLS